ncbi:MAG: sulfatase, partial [Acidobacteriota bacterium]
MRALLGGLAAAAGLVALGCAPAPPPAWNVLIVTFDTTRADHLGAYGHRGARTPVVDGLAADGVLFEHTYATVPITLPSHTTIMTGKVPLTHGVRDNGLFTVGAEQETLAEILGARGYRTAAAIGAFPLTAQFGLDQGFELYDDHVSADFEDLYGDRVVPKAELFFDERKAARVNEAALPWLEENADAPFFLWLHYFDPHYPHDPPPPYDQLFAHEPYDGEIAYADESLGVMLDHLERLGVRDRTLVVFTADHGEGRGEHNESTHSMLVYNSTMRVPLIVAVPGGQPAGRRVDERVSTVDILPTVLDLLGIAPPAECRPSTHARRRGVRRVVHRARRRSAARASSSCRPASS